MTAKKNRRTETSIVPENCLLPEPLSGCSIVCEVRLCFAHTAAKHVQEHIPLRGSYGGLVLERPEWGLGDEVTQVYRLKEYYLDDPATRNDVLALTRAWLEHAAEVELVDQWVCYRILDPRIAELEFRPIDVLFQSGYDFHYWRPFAYVDALRKQYQDAHAQEES